MAPEASASLQHLGLVDADHLPSSAASGQPDRAPDQSHPDIPERPAQERAPDHAVVLCRVADRYPAPAGKSERLALAHQHAGPLEGLGPVSTITKFPCEGI